MWRNTSGHSLDFALTVDTTVAPVSDLQVTDDVAQHTGPPTSGGLTNHAMLVLAGRRSRGDGHYLRTAARVRHPRWRMRTDTGASLRIPLGEGEHRLSTTVTDVAGNTSGHSLDFATVDTTVAPVGDPQVTDDVAQHTGPLTSGGLTNDATPASGTAEAGRRSLFTTAARAAPRLADEGRAPALHSGSAGRGADRPQHHGDRCGGNTSGPLAGLRVTVDTTVAPVSDLQVRRMMRRSTPGPDQRRADQ
ncbi:Ig-like domain-containing protein [Klebsiella pneumoniae]|uniref:Ig-like domain-containing protein n=1 Tax=Klebsiella pneumoniae TaxID=573 RepID=UPI003F65D902